MSDRNVDGYLFQDAEDADIAREEIQKIKYISDKMNEDNPEAVLAVYNKMLKSKIFATPVGYEYLREVQSYLYKSKEIPDAHIQDIPVRISIAESLNPKNSGNRQDIAPLPTKMPKNFKQEYKFSLLINAVLIVVVIAMFFIALKADNPNIINYRNAIENEYAQWEQELTEREAAIREKEAELE